jgi:hypothetical protein
MKTTHCGPWMANLTIYISQFEENKKRHLYPCTSLSVVDRKKGMLLKQSMISKAHPQDLPVVQK